MTRCSAQDSRNRVCLLPEDHRGKHLVSGEPFTLEIAFKVLDRWGIHAPDVRKATELRFMVGNPSAEAFMATLKIAMELRSDVFGDLDD